jgi:hypothetical protein
VWRLTKAEDVTTESFLTAFEKIDKYEKEKLNSQLGFSLSPEISCYKILKLGKINLN